MSASIYVNTYKRYNDGRIGIWIDIDRYENKNEFLGACRVLFSDEKDPELMFMDSVNVPSLLVLESDVDEHLFDWLKLNDYDKEIVEFYVDEYGGEYDNAFDAYVGKFDSLEEFGEYMLEISGEKLPDSLEPFFDYRAYAQSFVNGGGDYYETSNGMIFSRR